MMMKGLLFSSMLGLAFAGPVHAWGAGDPDKKTTFAFGIANAPKGTVCVATGAVGKVKATHFMGGSGVRIKGSAHIGDVSCTFPDGRRLETVINKTGVPQFPEAYAIFVTIWLDSTLGSVMVQTPTGQYEAPLKDGEGYVVR